MALKLERLSAVGVAKLRRPGYHADGGGLYLQVSAGGAKSWIFRFKLSGRAREMGLGSASTFSLAEARERATSARKLLADGIDPIEHRTQTRTAIALAASRAVTFKVAAEECIEAQRAGWSHPRQEAIWRASLETYAYPRLGAMLVAGVQTDDVLAVLKPIWSTKHETATRVRSRIEAVLDYAVAMKYRPEGANPARWRGNLDKLLAPSKRVAKVKHHAALPYADVPGFMERLRAVGGLGARALEFAILTAARSGEVRGATWAEIDLEAAEWRVPAERMKMRKAHRVPLSEPALALLRALPQGDGLVFPATKGGTLSDMTLSAVTKRMGVDAVPHGFRSSFRTWAGDVTSFPREVCEQALAHVVGDAAEQAYARGDLFAKRVALMGQWGQFCTTPPAAATVTPIRKNRAAR